MSIQLFGKAFSRKGLRIEKDETLCLLAEIGNVAQFASFSPELEVRHSRIKGFANDHTFKSIQQVIQELLRRSAANSVNIRTFLKGDLKGHDFIYGLRSKNSVIENLKRLSSKGYFAIVNETIDVNDGGVSGVAQNSVLEFSPGDTPRCVEKPGTLSISREMGMRLLEIVYGFRPALDIEPNKRVEFSIHPIRRGLRDAHTVLWEIGEARKITSKPVLVWPNLFSKFLGDKAFGLLITHLFGLPIPKTLVLARGVAPFQFGKKTGLHEKWIRSCPRENDPGRFPTLNRWGDPFILVAKSDPRGDQLGSIIIQDAIEPRYSGAALSGRIPTIDGVPGTGKKLMLAGEGPAPLPLSVYSAVVSLLRQLERMIGKGRLEWAFDGRKAWVVQYQLEEPVSDKRTIFPGKPKREHPLVMLSGEKSARNHDNLESLINRVKGSRDGIALVGNVGLTSHLALMLVRSKIPSRIVDAPAAHIENIYKDTGA